MTNKLGVHGLVFTDDWSETNAKAAIDAAARIGFDLIEVLIFDPAATDPKLIKRLAQDAGIDVAVGMALSREADMSSVDAAVAGKAEETVERCLEISAEIGAPALSGLVYAGLGRYTAPPTEMQRKLVSERLAGLDRKAMAKGLKLGLEAINRYETNMANTLDEAGDIIRAVGSKNMFIHLDTYHMNIEESDIAGAILRNRALIGYAHLADNHRGVLGTGTFDFTTLFRTLAHIGYAGAYTVESFSPAALSADTAGAISLWRRSWDSADAAAAAALAFMRVNLEAARSAQAVW
ncbi:TIM barrel protein [Mesorhizobium sp. IMUNJ 23232]|uniref:TIM barrel protein n=1 Tax=Mesorhizobium sp. IMUNJ 23232 TaxID=3376064 RepID=UPI003791E4B5